MNDNTKPQTDDECTVVGVAAEPPRLSPEAMGILAMHLVKGEAFADWMVKREDVELIPQIFLPIALAGRACLPAEEFYGGVYEFTNKVMPNTINGYPVFHSFRTLHKLDREPLLELVRKFHAKLQDMIKGAIGDLSTAANDG
jgi:hypothetical protein